MIAISVVITAAEGKGDDLEKEFIKLITQVRQEEGTLTYIVLRGLEDSSKFFVYEQYRAQEDLDSHTATPYYKEFGKAASTLIAGRPEVAYWREIG